MTDELYESALGHSPDSVSIYELDSTVVYMNPATERMMGAPFAELRGKRLFELYPDAVDSPFHVAFRRVVDGAEPQTFSHYYPRFDGWFANRVVRVGDRVHVYARDVTDEVRRQRRLDTVSRISDVLTRGDLDEVGTARAVVQTLGDVIDAQCSIAMLSDDGAWLDLVARAGTDPEAVATLAPLDRWPAGHGQAAVALQTKSAVLDVGPLTPVVIAPLFVGDAAFGIVTLSRRAGTAPLTHHERTLLAEVAPSIALYLANARRRAENDTLRGRLSALADALPMLAAFVDTNERYVYVNAAYGRWFGGDPQRYVGRSMRDVMGAEGYPTIAPFVGRVLAGEAVHFQQRIAYPSGVRDVDAQYVPVFGREGHAQGFAVIVRDISTEMTAKDMQRMSTQRLESLLAVTGRLAAAATPEDVAREVVEGIGSLVGSPGSSLWQVTEDGTTFRTVRRRGWTAEHMMLETMPVSAGGPLEEALRTNRSVWIENRGEFAARYPEAERATRNMPDGAHAFAVLPLVIDGRADTLLAFRYSSERAFTADERTYLEILASHAAEALRRARAYRELHDVNELQSAMIQSSPSAVILVDKSGIVRLWSGAAAGIFGWPADERVGRPMPVPEGELDGFLASLAIVLQSTDVFHREVRRQRANGEWFDAEIYAAPVRLASGELLAATMVFDITERKRVERGRELIAHASGRFNRTLDRAETIEQIAQLPLGDMADVSMVDLMADDGMLDRVLLVSAPDGSTRRVPLRVAHEPTRGGSSAAIEYQNPQLVRDFDDAAVRKLARDEDQLTALRELGLRSSLAVPMVAGGRVVGALSIGSRTRNYDNIDVSLLTELAAHASTALENARLFAEARSAREDAEDASQSKDAFLAMLGHELRNPLAPLVTALDLMQLRALPEFERERAIMRRQVDHLSRLVDDLLDVSRITRGKIELRKARLSLAEVVAKAVEQTSPLFDERRHYLTVDVPPPLVIDGDPTRMSQIVGNLLSNAAKYTPRNGTIEVSARRTGTDVELCVRDNGIGISPDMLPRVFELFAQAPQSSERPEGGLGLGLTIVKSLVELHGGAVSVRSDGPGHGSTFIVTLPAAAELHVAPLGGLAPTESKSAGARRVLVVDDNEDAALLLAEALDAHGYEIRTAFDGPSALRIADDFHPEVAILDIGLPVMDGYELAERLRSAPGQADLRLIAVTGYGQESDRARSRDAGFAAHLAKPVQVATLVRLVEHR